MDSVYPEPMSLLHRRVVPKKRRGTLARYRTQPVTFSEIQVNYVYLLSLTNTECVWIQKSVKI